MIELLVALLVFCLVIWVAQKLLQAFSVPEPISTVVFVVIVIVAVLYVVRHLGVAL